MANSIPVTAVIEAVRLLAVDTSLFCVRAATGVPVASSFLPGQFLELSLPGVGEIPVSYCGGPAPDGRIDLCIRHVGHVTTPLKNARPGDVVGVRGPFGRGFPLSAYPGQDLLLIAGGLGMAPLRSLLFALLSRRESIERLVLVYGAREAGALLFLDELLKLKKAGRIELQLGVDRSGSCLLGPPDCRVALLPALLDRLELDPARAFAAICGPPVVYPLIVSALRRQGFVDGRVHLSLERRMKCGVGRCGHCAVGNRLCCVDGPVFGCGELAGAEEGLE